jgi:hypothetical protein
MTTFNVEPRVERRIKGARALKIKTFHSQSTTMDPPTATMDLPTGWGKATYKDKKSFKRLSYYFNKEGLTSSCVPPPPQHYNEEASLHEDGDDFKKIRDLRLHFNKRSL